MHQHWHRGGPGTASVGGHGTPGWSRESSLDRAHPGHPFFYKEIRPCGTRGLFGQLGRIASNVLPNLPVPSHVRRCCGTIAGCRRRKAPCNPPPSSARVPLARSGRGEALRRHSPGLPHLQAADFLYYTCLFPRSHHLHARLTQQCHEMCPRAGARGTPVSSRPGAVAPRRCKSFDRHSRGAHLRSARHPREAIDLSAPSAVRTRREICQRRTPGLFPVADAQKVCGLHLAVACRGRAALTGRRAVPCLEVLVWKRGEVALGRRSCGPAVWRTRTPLAKRWRSPVRARAWPPVVDLRLPATLMHCESFGGAAAEDTTVRPWLG